LVLLVDDVPRRQPQSQVQVAAVYFVFKPTTRQLSECW